MRNKTSPVVITGYKAARTEPLTSARRQVNKLSVSVRAVCEHGFAVCEHGFAHLKNWPTITKLRLHVCHSTALLRALLVLTNIEVAR